MSKNRDKLGELLQRYQIKPPYCGAGCGVGWFPLIEDLIKELVAEGWDRDCHQIKEKFGGLRFYIGSTTESWDTIIAKYEAKSYTICEWCGVPGELRRDRSWMLTLCDQCHAVRRK